MSELAIDGSDDETCSCKEGDNDPCGINTNCENRALLIECGVSELLWK